jgi:hypothetical protein
VSPHVAQYVPQEYAQLRASGRGYDADSLRPISGRRKSLQRLSRDPKTVVVEPVALLDETQEREGVFVQDGHPTAA